MRLVCCRRRAKDISVDFDEHDRVVTYNGLESRITNSSSYDNDSGLSGGSGADGCVTTDSLDEDASSSSSSKNGFGSSVSSHYPTKGKNEEECPLYQFDSLRNLHFYTKGKTSLAYTMDASHVEAMKERFAKLLLGEDTSGGAVGISTALALSNAISNLSASVFGELWKLEPLSEEKKSLWRREMGWLLSPINYMVELVPSKQNGADGRLLEIMTPRARSDVHVNLLALQKLDNMLIGLLDSMVETEFWYAEGGSRAEGRSRTAAGGALGVRTSKKWWLPSPQVPNSGLSPCQRKRLCFQAKFVHQILKAAKSINEQVLLQIPVPMAIKDVLPKQQLCKASLGEEIDQAFLSVEKTSSVEEMLISLNMKNEHDVLEVVNRLEGSVLAWRHKISDKASKRSPVRYYPWHFVRDIRLEMERMEAALGKAEALAKLLKARFPNMPRTFIDASKIQYNMDVGHSIVEAYSRVLVGTAFSILMRVAEILQEDDVKKSPMAAIKFDFSSEVYLAGITDTPPPGHINRSLVHHMDMLDGRQIKNNKTRASPGLNL